MGKYPLQKLGADRKSPNLLHTYSQSDGEVRMICEASVHTLQESHISLEVIIRGEHIFRTQDIGKSL